MPIKSFFCYFHLFISQTEKIFDGPKLYIFSCNCKYISKYYNNDHNAHTIQEAVVIKGKIWRSLDLANQSNVTVSSNLNNSPNNHPTSTTSTTATNAHHNSLINANQTPHYQRHDFKNRRSSSEPANEQKMLSHIQSNPNNNISNSNLSNNQNNTTTIPNTSINQTNNCCSNNNTSLALDDASDIQNTSDDFIDCLHQKNIKVSKLTLYQFQMITRRKFQKKFLNMPNTYTFICLCLFLYLYSSLYILMFIFMANIYYVY